MSLQVPGIVGWSGTPATPDGDPAQLLADMCRAQPWASAPAGWGAAVAAAGVAAGGQAAVVDDLAVAIVGCPYWRDPALQRRQRDSGIAAALAAAWQSHGDAALGLLGGEFALAVLHRAGGRLLLATDRMARYPVFWSRSAGRLYFAGSADALAAVPAIDAQPSPQGLYHYVFFHMVPGPQSFFGGIDKLGAAQCLVFDGTRVEVTNYWVPEFAETDQLAPREAGEALLADIEAAVRVHVDDGVATGAFLSGGLDSSTVAGVLSRVVDRADVFSIGFDAEGYDEISYARTACEHFGLAGHEYYVTPDDILEALPSIAGAYDEPFGNSSALPAYFCARFAVEHGMQRLLAGDGGDELFAGNERYAKQAVFEHYRRVPRWLRAGVLEPVVTRLPQGLPLFAKAQSYLRQANVPLPERLQQYNFLVRLAAEDMFVPELLAEVDRERPFALQRDVYRRPAEATPLNRMLYLDWQFTLADNDLRKVSRMCQLAGVDVCYPLLDDRVIDFSLRVPSRQKLRSGRLRHFYREAMRGFLPQRILDKSKHGFGLPFGVWTRNHDGLNALVADTLGRLKQRGYFRPGFIEQARELHRSGHAAYYGELIWIMMMLELWLAARDRR